jgi:hypothetical protein
MGQKVKLLEGADVEVKIEANPSPFSAGHVVEYKALG